MGRGGVRVAAPAQAGEGGRRVGVEILGPEPAVARLDGWIVAALVGHAKQLEDIAVFSAPLDRYTERGHEGQLRQPQDVRPSRPDACLVDERLADIETDPPRHQMSRSSRPAAAKASRQACSSSRLCSLETMVRMRARSSATVG